MSFSATTTAIPLTTVSQPQPANNANMLGVNSNAPSLSSTRPTPPSSQQIAAIDPPNNSFAPTHAVTAASVAPTNANQSQATSRHSNRTHKWTEQLTNAFSFANGLGTMALIAAFIFGVGAWVGMKVQINQGGKSMELAIWTACADHQMLQNSSLCQSIMAKDFSSEFSKRDLIPTSQELTVMVKRDHVPDDNNDPSHLTPKQQQPSAIKASSSPYSTFLSSLSPLDRSLIDTHPESSYNHYTDPDSDPALRATIFPFVQLLTTPLHWLFDFIESLLLLLIYTLHKLFSWLTTIVIVILQAFLYSWIESLIKSVLATIDVAIANAMPEWMPYILVSNLASLLGLSALRSAWYGVNYLESLKWIFIFRVGMWVLFEAGKGCVWLVQHCNEIAEEKKRRRGVQGNGFGSSLSEWSTGSTGTGVMGGLRRQGWLDRSSGVY